MKKVYPSVRQFLDTEARVDEESDMDNEDDEEARREMDDFLVDDGDDDDDSGINERRTANIQSSTTREQALDTLIERILQSAATRSGDQNANSERYPETILDKLIAYQPKQDDYPLWQVDCRVGTEEIAVFTLMGTVTARHQVRSAFTRGSVRGSICLECTMNQDLVCLLKITPGIIRNREGVRRRIIEEHDYFETLKVKNHAMDVQAGDWVVVKKGLYKGDVAFVAEAGGWGARLLLVPRVDLLPSFSRKRKASCLRPRAELFHPDAVPIPISSKIISHGDGSYSLGHCEFRNGLLEKNFDYHSFTKGVRDIPYPHFLMFKQSQHPEVILSRLPRPREWCMKENDSVLILSRGETAILESAEPFYAKVERGDPLQPDSELRYTDHVPWHDILKYIQIGQFIRVGSGSQAGSTGWVVETKDEFATFAAKVTDGEIFDHNTAVELVDVLVNCVELAEPPAILHHQITDLIVPQSGVAQKLLLEQARRHPWCGTKVIISKPFHPRKGEVGEIKAVIQQDDDIFKFDVQLTRYNPSAPFQHISLDYDDVLEQTTLKHLIDFFDPGGESYAQLRKRSQERIQKILEVISAAYVTPLPATLQDPSDEPVGDPSSRIPCPLILESPQSTSHSQSAACPLNDASSNATKDNGTAIQHILYNPQLDGVHLNVIANGGGFVKKEVPVTISRANDATSGAVVVRHKKYHTCILLQPAWITPKHPSPTHDNGLLVVISGDHVGKYVRRIHHRRLAYPMTLVIVAVVSRVEGKVDELTGEQLELGVELLCTVTESKKQKDLNWNVMTQIRQQWRAEHKRA